jgi:hypothetical protein
MLVLVYRDNAMKKTAVYKWVTHFSEGRESFTDAERSGRPAKSRENRRMTVRSIAEQANINTETVKKILNDDLDMKKVCKNGSKGPAHRALSMREFLDSKQITVLENPHSSPDLAPSDFFLFPKIKEISKGRHSDDTDDIRSNMTKPVPKLF